MPINPTLVMATQQEAGVQNIGNRRGGRRTGYVGTSATTAVAVRATAYTPQGTDAQRSVDSTSANDTAAGTGARTVRITYYKADGSGPFTTDVILNGLTAVNTTATDIALIESIEVLTVGSGGGNAGTIRIWTQTNEGGSIWGSIAAGDNRTYWAHHYVPPGYTCFITELDVCSKAAVQVNGVALLNALDPTDVSIVQKNLDISFGYSNTVVPKTFIAPILVMGPAIIFLVSRPDSSTASTTHGGFGFVEMPTV